MHMIEVKNIVKRDIIADEDVVISGILEGDVYVNKNVNVQINGIVNGNLKITSVSSIKISGTLNGDIINDGGIIEVFGVMNGKIDSENGQCFIHPDAMISG
jgi:hypothetical protein